MLPEDDIEIPIPLRHMRRFAVDGGLLLFDRDSGINALCDGAQTAHLRQRAPRTIQFAITNICNLACTFCSRDLKASSSWTQETAFTFLSQLAEFGVLEVAFGGGEPWLFPGFELLVRRLYYETPLAVNVTTNGVALTKEHLANIRGVYGQIRLSLYDNNDWLTKVAMLAEENARFGVNYLITPARLPEFEATVLRLAANGCSDILLLSYNGNDLSLHLSQQQALQLANRVKILARALAPKVQLKLSVCWGERMEAVPQLFANNDCGAGREFLVITSDKKVMPCSFHQVAIPVNSASEVLAIWKHQQAILTTPAHQPGCARIPGFGLEQ